VRAFTELRTGACARADEIRLPVSYCTCQIGPGISHSARAQAIRIHAARVRGLQAAELCSTLGVRFDDLAASLRSGGLESVEAVFDAVDAACRKAAEGFKEGQAGGQARLSVRRCAGWSTPPPDAAALRALLAGQQRQHETGLYFLFNKVGVEKPFKPRRCWQANPEAVRSALDAAGAWVAGRESGSGAEGFWVCVWVSPLYPWILIGMFWALGFPVAGL
jgi:hypothetical protein